MSLNLSDTVPKVSQSERGILWSSTEIEFDHRVCVRKFDAARFVVASSWSRNDERRDLGSRVSALRGCQDEDAASESCQ